MPLILSDEAQMVRETALDFFRERSPITALRKLRDDNDPDGFSRNLWRQMAELGWTGFLVPEDDGGSAFGMTGLAQVMEAARTHLGGLAADVDCVAGGVIAAMGGSEEQKAEYLPPLLAGEHIFALALEEGARHAPEQDPLTGGTGRQRLSVERSEDLRAGWPCRRHLDRRGANSRRHHPVPGPRRRCHAASA